MMHHRGYLPSVMIVMRVLIVMMMVLHVGCHATRPALSNEYGTCKTVRARFWLWFSGKIL